MQTTCHVGNIRGSWLQAGAYALYVLDVLPLAQSYSYDCRNTRLLHCDTVDSVSCLHRTRVVSYDQELSVQLELFQESSKPADVSIIQRGVDLVHQAERTRLGEINAK